MADSAPSGPEPRDVPSFSRFIIRAPSVLVSLGLVVVLSAVLATAVWTPSAGPVSWAWVFGLGVLAPGLVAAFLTPAFASALGGRIPLRRSVLLVGTAMGICLPLVLALRVAGLVAPATLGLGTPALLLFLLGPILWFRHMSLFGVSAPSHPRSLGPSLLQPVLMMIGVFVIFGVSVAWLVGGVLFLLLGFGCCALLLRASDRPLRREFGVSGVSLIRPLLDHINLRDPGATEALEAFFAGFARPANLRVSLMTFRRRGRPPATIALPTVHPGPFAALGGSDLPRKFAERLEPAAGTLLVPHTPCNHDLDLPSGREVDRMRGAASDLLAALRPEAPAVASPLVAPHEGSFARAQLVGDTALVLVTQAPSPTDDIDFAVLDEWIRTSTHPRVAVIDAHNSYVEDRGDITYGTPAADRLQSDAKAAVAAAVRAARPGPFDVGVASRGGYSIGSDGIGPSGIRALVVRAGGATTAYVLIDGNNLLVGRRAPLLEALHGLVDAAEVMTTDNHVVHEVDGSINPVGERRSVAQLAADVRGVVEQAVADLTPAEVGFGSVDVPDVPVLGPDWTARLLTSLGDTVSMFGHAFVMTFLLLVASSLVVLAALR